MAKQDATVEELVGMMNRGEIGLPEMQRRYVWRSTRVRDLLDSLYRGYPSGAILLWETDEQVPLQSFAVDQEVSAFRTRRLLLDGQQRLTSLAAVINGKPVTVRGRQKPIEILFNLEHPDQLAVVTEVNEDSDEDDDDLIEDEADSSEDELQKRFNKMTFVVTTKKLEASPQWVKVSEVFKADEDASFLQRTGVERVDDPRFKRYSQRLARLRAIRKYTYRMDVLERTLSYDEVTEIFVRVNSLGAKLRGSDLALAQITAKWPNSLKIFQQFQKECAAAGFDLDLGLHLKNMISFATGQSRFLTVSSQSVDTLKKGWENACAGMHYALNFLRKNVGIESPALLSSPFILVTLGFFGHMRGYEISPEESDRLRFWVLLANAKGRYSRGSSETILDQDLGILKQGAGTAELIDRLRQQVGRLQIAPDELEGRNQRSALFKTMFLAFSSAGAKDWQSNLAIAIDHSGAQHRLQFHHIFPKALLKTHYSSREADDIANLSFIGGGANRNISAKPPSAYFPILLAKNGEMPFVLQCIPTAPAVLELQNYKQFLTERRRLIANRLNEFLGVEEMPAADVAAGDLAVTTQQTSTVAQDLRPESEFTARSAMMDRPAFLAATSGPAAVFITQILDESTSRDIDVIWTPKGFNLHAQGMAPFFFAWAPSVYRSEVNAIEYYFRYFKDPAMEEELRRQVASLDHVATVGSSTLRLFLTEAAIPSARKMFDTALDVMTRPALN